MKPFFTIIVATYNRANLILKAVDSVISQTFGDWELLIIDDGSTDNTKEILGDHLNHPQIRYEYQENKGRSLARNKGIKLAQGQFLCFLDSDDYYLENHLMEFKLLVEKNRFKNAIYFCDTYEERGGVRIKISRGKLLSNLYDFIITYPIGTPRVCLPKAILEREDLFDKDLSVGEDVEFWLRLMPIPMYTHEKYTQVYLEHENRSISANNVQPLWEDFQLKKRLTKNYRKHISSEAKNRTLAYCNLRLARYYSGRERIKCLKFSFMVLFNGGKQYWKELVLLNFKGIINR